MQSLVKSFFNTIRKEDLFKTSGDLTEILLDNFIKDEFLKSIPVFGVLIGLYNAGSDIKQLHTLKKIALFLQSISDVDEQEKEKFIEKISDEKEQQELSENLLIVLDRLDESEKAKMLANAFKLYILDVIGKANF